MILCQNSHCSSWSGEFRHIHKHEHAEMKKAAVRMICVMPGSKRRPFLQPNRVKSAHSYGGHAALILHYKQETFVTMETDRCCALSVIGLLYIMYRKTQFSYGLYDISYIIQQNCFPVGAVEVSCCMKWFSVYQLIVLLLQTYSFESLSLFSSIVSKWKKKSWRFEWLF